MCILLLKSIDTSHDGGVGRHDSDIMGTIYGLPEYLFLTIFRMHPPSFWQLFNVLKDAGRRGTWMAESKLGEAAGGSPPRPAYQQIAVTLSVLGAAGGRENAVESI